MTLTINGSLSKRTLEPAGPILMTRIRKYRARGKLSLQRKREIKHDGKCELCELTRMPDVEMRRVSRRLTIPVSFEKKKDLDANPLY